MLIVSLTILIAIVGTYAAGQYARHRLANKFPPPGQFVQSGDRKLHVQCSGDGPVTILLESGLNDFSLHWYRLFPLLSKETKTCAYDRAGLGWSGSNPSAANIQDAANDLNQIVSSVASDSSPVVLVGHSYGSLIVRLFAQQHPKNIRAIVLLDPANEYMSERIEGYGEVLKQAASQFKTLSLIAKAGLVALLPDKIPAGDLSGEVAKSYRAVLAFGNFLAGAALESEAMVSNLRFMQSQDQNNLREIPIVIISRGLSDPIPGLPEETVDNLESTWANLQSDLVTRLHAKQLFAKNSHHNIQISEPDIVYQTIKPYLSNQR